MTLSEFKAWFEGFSEGIEAAPTAEQFAKIKAKVALIDGSPITYPIFIDRYRWWQDRIWTAADPYPYTATLSGVGVSSSEGTVFADYSDGVHRGPLIGEPFDSHAAMRELGRAEAMN